MFNGLRYAFEAINAFITDQLLLIPQKLILDLFVASDGIKVKTIKNNKNIGFTDQDFKQSLPKTAVTITYNFNSIKNKVINATMIITPDIE